MIKAIIFDLGGVLIDWNPRLLYRKIFSNEEQITHFLDNVCTPDWNEEQDAGRSLADGTELLVRQHPEHEDNIRAFYSRWTEMLGGEIAGTVELFNQLRNDDRFKLYALTNWSAETFVIAEQEYPFLKQFDGVVVSGIEKTRKPHAEFYRILLERYNVKPEEALFIDDNLRNVEAAIKLGIDSIRFTSANELKTELQTRAIL
ncbi:HAD family phosphatase [Mucilaginibacter sp. UR6-1]|uniref:HAD family hydrolase n=1 Tax=Mucilaginibacter sp. UR6-1 TaxID=1435643 RepID=UPI001E386D2D|nr:HAD family phosphatase [Mucilaginibacter sp. UR6-1]MCC8409486.1 HAD family phosphatase [Mucilaginibacter sp. UR6-1]